MLKRVFCICLTVLFALGCGSVFAAEDIPDWEQPLNAEGTAEMTAILNQPLLFLEGAEDASLMPAKELLEGLFGTTVKATAKYDISEDYKSIKMETASNVVLPLLFSEDLKVTADLTGRMWINMDISDAGNPVFMIIYKNPAGDNYTYIDYATAAQGSEEARTALSQLSALFDSDFMAEAQNLAKELYQKHGSLTFSGGKLAITLDDAGLKGLLKDTFQWTKDQVMPSAGATEADLAALDEVIAAFDTKLDDVRILGEDGMTTEITLEGGTFRAGTTTVHVQTNIYDWMDAFSDTPVEVENRENGVLDFTLNMTETYTNQGETTVQFPLLTEENSFDMGAFLSPDYTPQQMPEYIPSQDAVITREGSAFGLPVIQGGQTYLPLRGVMGAMGVAGEDISVRDGVITIINKAPDASFQTASVAETGNVFIVDGIQYPMVYPMIEQDGVCYIPVWAIANVFGGELRGVEIGRISFNVSDGNISYGTTFWIDMPNPAYQNVAQ